VIEPNELPVLMVQAGKLQGQRWTLTEGEFIIGRGADCDLMIPDRQVSRHHARIRKTDRGYVLEDLGSKNGTHLNGVLLESPQMLQDGDLIQVALAVKLAFIGTEATVPLTMGDEVPSPLTGMLRMDPQAHRVWIRDQELDPPLSPPQYKLLKLLYDNLERVVSRDEIAEEVWPGTQGVGVSNQAIDALVRRLRDRLSELEPDHAFVVTVRGHGFRLDNPPA
jgi:hypothetical protein